MCISWKRTVRDLPNSSDMDLFSSVQTRYILKAEAQKSPHCLVGFSEGGRGLLLFWGYALLLGLPLKRTLKASKIAGFYGHSLWIHLSLLLIAQFLAIRLKENPGQEPKGNTRFRILQSFPQVFWLREKMRKCGRVQKSMGHKVPWMIGIVTFFSLQLRDHLF